MRGKSRTQHHGFSLIELLVVVAIIIVLLALLLPTIKRSKYMASDIRCRKNKEQLVAALTLYAADHDGAYPARWAAPTIAPNQKVYWHPYWFGRTNNNRFDLHEEFERYCGSPGSLPEALLCGVTGDNMWGIANEKQWPLGSLYRTSVAVYAGWNWQQTTPGACKPQLPYEVIPMRTSEVQGDRPIVGDVIEFLSGAHPVYNGWMTGHSSDSNYHIRTAGGPSLPPPDPIPFGYADGSVRATRTLEPLYLDRGWAMRWWAAPVEKE